MKLNKPYTNTQYADFAVYCNQKGLIIEDKGDYLEAVNPPEKSVEEKEAEVRAVRNQYLAETDKYMIPDFPITEEERQQYRDYRQYLRDYTKEENWFEQNPKVFEEWKEDLNATEQIETMRDVYGTV